MFREIFLFEIKLGFKKPATYIYFAIYFLLNLMLGLAAAGFFDVATMDTNTVANSASVVAGILVGMNQDVLGLVNSVILVAIMATAIQRDYEYNTFPFFFTKPITKTQYYFGRFLGAFLLGVFVFSGQLVGYFLGTLYGAGTPLMGPFLPQNFLMPFLIFVVPNLLLLGSIVFSLTTFTRSTFAAYLFCIVLLVIRLISDRIISDLDNKELAAILEPFGAQAFMYITEYWTPAEQNTRMIPLSGVLLYNRLIWTGVALLICFISFYKFSFQQFLTPIRWFSKSRQTDEASAAHIQEQHTLADLPKVTLDFSWKSSLKQWAYLSVFELKKLVQTPFFLIIALLGLIMMLILAQYMGSIYDTVTYPVTYQILEMLSGIFQLFILILIVFFSGTLIWRDREQKTDELIGVTPVSNSVLFFSKFTGLVLSVMLLNVLIMVTGIAIQLSSGFTDVQPLQYIQTLFGRRLLSTIIIIGFSMAVQVYTPNKYLGFFINLVVILFTSLIFGLLEWNHPLYHFNSSGPSLPYSDMNGFGHLVGVFLLFKTYWMAIVMLLILPATLLWARGKESGWKARYKLSKELLTPTFKLSLVVCLLIAIVTGGYIYYNLNVLNSYKSPKEDEKELVAYEQEYKHLQHIPQLRVTAVSVQADIYPESRSLKAKGRYTLRNNHQIPVDTLVINSVGGEKSWYSYRFSFGDNPDVTLLKNDSLRGITIYKFTNPVAPGDSVVFDFELAYAPRGFASSPSTMIVENGTFFNNKIFPSIGYDPNYELSSNTARKKYGLPAKPRMADINDSLARMNNYIANDADWIRFEAVVSTSEDQIAIAPGYLEKQWKENGRNYFYYKMDSPILHFYAFQSARYQIKRDSWKGVNIEIYYHKGHEYNLDRMIESIKSSLAYYTENFSPYQHRQVRIIEFPRYASFAQSFPNTIPFSESIGFIAKMDKDDPESIDVPFYVTAHEVAHQWWAHQVIGGNVQGSVVMSETMSQYAALMVMEKTYGKKAMKKFLKHEMDDYLSGRTMENKKEVPLMLCENQGYIHYSKGSVVMYALRDYLGEDVLNAAIRKYLQQTAFSGPMYTNAIEFVNTIKEYTPDSLVYLVKDMFEEITVYENYVKSLDYKQKEDGTYEVTFTVGAAKYYADSLGKQKRVPVADYIDVAVFGETEKGEEDKELWMQRIKMDQEEKTFTIQLAEKPISVGIDPYLKLIDRSPINNVVKFGHTPPKVSLDEYENRPKGIVVEVES